MSRAAIIHCAQAYIAESRRRGRQQFAFVLLNWAASARRRAMRETPAQGELFGGKP